jgi:hypothetical protein
MRFWLNETIGGDSALQAEGRPGSIEIHRRRTSRDGLPSGRLFGLRRGTFNPSILPDHPYESGLPPGQRRKPPPYRRELLLLSSRLPVLFRRYRDRA